MKLRNNKIKIARNMENLGCEIGQCPSIELRAGENMENNQSEQITLATLLTAINQLSNDIGKVNNRLDKLEEQNNQLEQRLINKLDEREIEIKLDWIEKENILTNRIDQCIGAHKEHMVEKSKEMYDEALKDRNFEIEEIMKTESELNKRLDKLESHEMTNNAMEKKLRELEKKTEQEIGEIHVDLANLLEYIKHKGLDGKNNVTRKRGENNADMHGTTSFQACVDSIDNKDINSGSVSNPFTEFLNTNKSSSTSLGNKDCGNLKINEIESNTEQIDSLKFDNVVNRNSEKGLRLSDSDHLTNNLALSRNLFGDMTRPKFMETKTNPSSFISELDEYIRIFNVPEELKLPLARRCLEGKAIDWFNLTIDKACSYQEFKSQFLNRFWSASRQSSVIRDLMSGSYDSRGKQSMADYYMEKAQIGKLVRPVITDKQIIDLVTNHFPPLVKNHIYVAKPNTPCEMLDLLVALGSSDRSEPMLMNSENRSAYREINQLEHRSGRSYNSEPRRLGNSRNISGYHGNDRQIPTNSYYPADQNRRYPREIIQRTRDQSGQIDRNPRINRVSCGYYDAKNSIYHSNSDRKNQNSMTEYENDHDVGRRETNGTY